VNFDAESFAYGLLAGFAFAALLLYAVAASFGRRAEEPMMLRRRRSGLPCGVSWDECPEPQRRARRTP
jgi:hypothetical protein